MGWRLKPSKCWVRHSAKWITQVNFNRLLINITDRILINVCHRQSPRLTTIYLLVLRLLYGIISWVWWTLVTCEQILVHQTNIMVSILETSLAFPKITLSGRHFITSCRGQCGRKWCFIQPLVSTGGRYSPVRKSGKNWAPGTRMNTGDSRPNFIFKICCTQGPKL